MRAQLRQVGVGAAMVAALVGGGAHAQSEQLLQAVRLHRPGAAVQARVELEACRVKKCAQQGRLALLAGTLTLSEGQALHQGRALLALRAARRAPAPPAPSTWARPSSTRASPPRRPSPSAAPSSRPPPRCSRVPAPAGRRCCSPRGSPRRPLRCWRRPRARSPPRSCCSSAPPPARPWAHAKGALDDLRRVAVESPEHAYADEALAKLAAQRPAVVLKPEERLRRAKGLLEAGQSQRSLDELEALERTREAKKPALRAQVELTRARALYALGQEAAAEAALARVRKGPREYAAEGALLRARRALRNPDNSVPRALMAAVVKSYPREGAADEASFFVGWLELQAGRLSESVEAFDDFEQRFPRSRRRDEGLWFRALAHLQLQQYAEARGALSRLVTLMPRSSLVPQAQYWIARSEALGGAGPEAVAPAYETLIRSAPGSYYALLAAERLRELERVPPRGFPERPRLMPGQTPPQLALAEALSEAGLFRDAADEVRAQAARLRSSSEALPFAHALLQLGAVRRRPRLAARLLWGQAYTARAPEALAAFYPRAYAGAVEHEAERHQVDPYLVWAIMRRESALPPGRGERRGCARADAGHPAHGRGHRRRR